MQAGTNYQKIGFFSVTLSLLMFFASAFGQAVDTGSGFQFFLFDDAHISLRYALNLIHGNGLTWNPGEHVLGISNILWTLIMGLVALVVPSPLLLPLAITLLNSALHALLAITVFRWIERDTSCPHAAWAGWAITFFSLPLIRWGMMGMEVPIQAVLMLFMFRLVLSASRPDSFSSVAMRSALPIAWLAFLTRFDSFAFNAVALLILARRLGSSRQLTFAKTILWVLAFASIPVLLKYYYDEPLPNTYALKAEWSRELLGTGIGYFGSYLSNSIDGVLLILIPLLLLRLGWSLRAVALVLAPLFVHCAYVMSVGGDAFANFRFLAPMSPCIALLSGYGVAGILKHLKHSSSPTPLGWQLASVFFASAIGFATWKAGQRSIEHRLGGETLEVAEWIRKQKIPKDQPVGIMAAGMLPYLLPDYRFLDLYGKCDRHIAHTAARYGVPGHRKWDLSYSFAQVKPALVILTIPAVTNAETILRRVEAREKPSMMIEESAEYLESSADYKREPFNALFPSLLIYRRIEGAAVSVS